MITFEEYEIPTHMAVALINGDYSGLSDEDIVTINEFIEEVVAEFGNANFMLGDKSHESCFSPVNDVNKFAGDTTILYIII